MEVVAWLIKERSKGDARKRSLATLILAFIAFFTLLFLYLWTWKFIIFALSILTLNFFVKKNLGTSFLVATTVLLLILLYFFALLPLFLIILEPKSIRWFEKSVKLFVRAILLRTYLKLCLLNQADWAM